MSELSDNAGSSASAGERLKQAREHAGLSLEKIAKDLYLDTRVIQAIEGNHFSELGAPVYAKGYLRKYARLVGLSEEDVLTQYQLSPDATPAPVIIPVALGSIPDSRQPLPTWVRWLVLAIIVIAGGATLMNLHSSDNESSTQNTLISHPLLSAVTGVVSKDGSEPVSTVSDSPLAALPDKPTLADAVNVRFNFNGDSWIEVYDTQNQSLLHETVTANSTRNITAEAPLRVVVGKADAVRINVNSHDVEIPAASRQANVARFVVKADGSLE